MFVGLTSLSCCHGYWIGGILALVAAASTAVAATCSVVLSSHTRVFFLAFLLRSFMFTIISVVGWYYDYNTTFFHCRN